MARVERSARVPTLREPGEGVLAHASSLTVVSRMTPPVSLWPTVGGGGLARAVRWPLVLAVLAALWGVYLIVLHPWLMSWGATAEEVAASLPGDEVAGAPYLTRGLTIDAPPAGVWPWIVQIGQDRGGFYSNTWLENLTGADIHNADSAHPEWQHRALGDRVPLAHPDLLGGLLAGVSHTDVVLLEPETAIANIPGRFVLRRGERTTRLLVRESLRDQGPLATRWLVWDPMHFVMVQRMMRGIKERAEGRPLVAPWAMSAARFGWAAVAGLLVLAFLARRHARPWLSLALLPPLAPLSATGDRAAFLAGFLAIGITVAGALAFGRRFWPAYALLAAVVLLVLLLAPDAYVAFGLAFDFGLMAALTLAVAGARR